MPEQSTKFDDWFEEQFGPCPTEKSYSALVDDLKAAESLVAARRRLLEDLEYWGGQHNAALLAWNARREEY